MPPFKTISHNKNVYKKCKESCNSVKVERRGFSFTLKHTVYPFQKRIVLTQTKLKAVQYKYIMLDTSIILQCLRIPYLIGRRCQNKSSDRHMIHVVIYSKYQLRKPMWFDGVTFWIIYETPANSFRLK